MRILSFIGKNRHFRTWLAAQLPDNVVQLQRCELCGRMAAGAICRKCEPMYLKWKKKIALELKATKPHNPSIA